MVAQFAERQEKVERRGLMTYSGLKLKCNFSRSNCLPCTHKKWNCSNSITLLTKGLFQESLCSISLSVLMPFAGNFLNYINVLLRLCVWLKLGWRNSRSKKHLGSREKIAQANLITACFIVFFRGTARVLCRFSVFHFKTTRQLEQIFFFPDENFVSQ